MEGTCFELAAANKLEQIENTSNVSRRWSTNGVRILMKHVRRDLSVNDYLTYGDLSPDPHHAQALLTVLSNITMNTITMKEMWSSASLCVGRPRVHGTLAARQ